MNASSSQFSIISFLQVYGWGRGEHGRLGFGDDKSSKMVPQRVLLLDEEDIVQVLMCIISNTSIDPTSVIDLQKI